MRLPILLPNLHAQRFDCHSCTNCCRELVVHLTPRDREKIDRQAWGGRLEMEPYVRLGREHVLNHRPGGGCVFLREDGRCRIHADFGAEEKPLACQLFPFTLEREPDGLRAGIRFDCPSVTRNHGSPLSSHAGVIEVLADRSAEEIPALAVGPTRAPQLLTGRDLGEDELGAILDSLDAWLRDTNQPLPHRLLGLCSFVDTLSAAKLAGVRGDRFTELIGLLIAELPIAASSIAGSASVPPSDRQLRLLRQAVFAHTEHIGLEQARASAWSAMAYRWGQFRRSRTLAAGVGRIPPLRSGLPPVAFEAQQKIGPAPMSAREIDDLLTRYLRARIGTHSAFGAGYYGWPVLDGLAALLLAVAAAGWLARYFAAAAGRPVIALDDAVSAIGLIDRAAGRAGELGRVSAGLRMRYLRADQGLIRLLRTYPFVA